MAALALAFGLAHAPFLASTLGDADSVNFALGVRDFDVSTHRPHPPGYPVYILAGKAATAVARVAGASPASKAEAGGLAWLSLLSGIAAAMLLVHVARILHRSAEGEGDAWRALATAAITAVCPLFWYLASRPLSDLSGLAAALAAQACLLLAWQRQAPGPGGDRRLTPAATAASGRMIVAGALVAAVGIGVRTQVAWVTLPLLGLVLVDRIGRGVAGAIVGGTVSFLVGGLAWAVPLVVVSGGLDAYLAALGTQASEDFASGEMLYTHPSLRAAARAAWQTVVAPWDSSALGAVVAVLAAVGLVAVARRDRRALAAVTAMAGPYVVFHLLFHDTAFVRYALPLVPVMVWLAVTGASMAPPRAAAAIAAGLFLWALSTAGPVLAVYGSGPSPSAQVVAAMRDAAAFAAPGALGMHQRFARPLEAEEVDFLPRLPSPPRLEWLEAVAYWRAGHTGPLWFLADPMRSDLALIDPQARADFTDYSWPLVARPSLGGLRPTAVRWYRMPPPGWFAETGWALTPEIAGVSKVMGRGPHLGPIAAWVRRRPRAARVLVGGRNLAGPGDPAARFVLAIDGQPVQTWEAPPGFFVRVFDLAEGQLLGAGPVAALTIVSSPVSGSAVIPTAIEQFDLQDPLTTVWAYGPGWHEAEFTPALGVWRWTSDRADLRIEGATVSRQITLSIESPRRYYDDAPRIRARAGSRELSAATVPEALEWTFEVPADALAASGGVVTIETDRTFVPAERDGGPDRRRLGLRIFGIRVSNALTPREATR